MWWRCAGRKAGGPMLDKKLLALIQGQRTNIVCTVLLSLAGLLVNLAISTVVLLAVNLLEDRRKKAVKK